MKKPDPPRPAPRRPLSEIVVNGDLQGNLMAAACPSREVLNHVTSRWGVLVLMALETRTLRFSQLKRQIGGVSERMLAQTLKALEGDGFVLRQAFEVVPPHVEYSLTPLGLEVAERVRGLADWIEVNLPRILENWEPEAVASYAPETVA
ncbi:transcriptional regulator [Caulobacter vibrioides]|uniref:winged helix-turn-helix transcriptional regulator n=1 Tax=Caulobacter vibrioides TaxID=155892 RepID=UPI000BB4E9A9|nr:helix-turn-helix domain-containing protein [Caulobacter vibrioides]ATC26240.1 transcriptional regulator [Caulobacter vibrioides]AZH14381.1 transcriptional regulator [Caulobacter vibrioides]PLR10904.1 transcriptional regulator [Caulobacter vibrioides]